MKSALAVLAHGLRCNVVAGARLAAFLRVTAFDYRVSPADFAVLFAFIAAVAAAGSFVRGGLPGRFDLGAIPLLLAEIPIVFLACTVIAGILGRRELVLGLGTALFASDPVFEVAGTALMFGLAWVPPGVASAIGYAYLAWALATVLRALVVFNG